METANVFLDEAACREHHGFNPGDYVRLIASDNGSGMDGETPEHLFEPFFIIKKVGKGTGLGLVTVYGSVKQTKGFISVYNEPGEGASFQINFPRAMGLALAVQTAGETPARYGRRRPGGG